MYSKHTHTHTHTYVHPLEHSNATSYDVQYGHTPLNTASLFGNQDVVKYLIEKGASVDAVDKVCCVCVCVPLYKSVAVLCFHDGIVVAAVVCSFVWVHTLQDGNTPLHLCASKGNRHMVELLILLGSPIEPRNKV